MAKCDRWLTYRTEQLSIFYCIKEHNLHRDYSFFFQQTWRSKISQSLFCSLCITLKIFWCSIKFITKNCTALRGMSGRLCSYSTKLFEVILSKNFGQFDSVKFKQYEWKIPWIVRQFIRHLVICGLCEMFEVGSATCG